MADRPPPYPMDPYFDESTVTYLPESIAYAAEPYLDLSKPAGGNVQIKEGSQAGQLLSKFNSMISTLTQLNSTADSLLATAGISVGAGSSSGAASGEVKLGKHGEILPPDSESAAPPYKLAVSIAASPDQPPLGSLAVLGRAPVSLAVNTFWHSSVKRPGEARPATSASSGDVGVALIWKKVSEPEACISPSQSCTISGDANIARLFARLYSPELTLPGKPIAAAQVDQWVDKAEQLASSTSKEQKIVMKSLNQVLGKSAYAVGDTLTLADIVLWSYITNFVSGSLPSNIKKWKKSLDEMEGFSPSFLPESEA